MPHTHLGVEEVTRLLRHLQKGSLEAHPTQLVRRLVRIVAVLLVIRFQAASMPLVRLLRLVRLVRLVLRVLTVQVVLGRSDQRVDVVPFIHGDVTVTPPRSVGTHVLFIVRLRNASPACTEAADE